MDVSTFGHAALGVGAPSRMHLLTDSAFVATPLYLTRYLPITTRVSTLFVIHRAIHRDAHHGRRSGTRHQV